MPRFVGKRLLQRGAEDPITPEKIGDVMLVGALQLFEVNAHEALHSAMPLRLPLNVHATSIVVASIPKGMVIEDDLVFHLELPPSFAMSVGFFDRGLTVDVVVTILPDSAAGRSLA